MSGHRRPGLALMAGNFVIGASVLAPAGMIDPLAADLSVSVGQAAFLITAGAILLCVGSPLVAWATASIDRRLLLTLSLGMLGLAHLGSALAPDYPTLLGLRLVAMAFAAIFTPQAASAIAMLASEKDRSGAIAFVFLGWSLAAAFGLPLIAWFAAAHDWRLVYGALAVAALASAALVAFTLPSGLRSAAMSLASWGILLRNRLVVSVLGATVLSSAGQFVVFTYFGPLLARTAAATPGEIAACFAAFGMAGFLGNVAATRIVGRVGLLATSLLFFGCMLTGAVIWSLGSTSIAVAAVGAAIWGLGFAASNSMQQARLAAAAPIVAGAAIALNSSSIYIGQAAGSATGAAMFEAGYYGTMGWTAAAFLAATLVVIASTRGLPGLAR